MSVNGSVSGEVDSYADALHIRQRSMAKNATLSYDKPVLMCSAQGATMVDERGTQWLDCANNVAHVGHSEASVRSLLRGHDRTGEFCK